MSIFISSISIFILLFCFSLLFCLWISPLEIIQGLSYLILHIPNMNTLDCNDVWLVILENNSTKKKKRLYQSHNRWMSASRQLKLFFLLSLSFVGPVVPVRWASSPHQTSDFTLFPPPLYLHSSNLGRDCLVWKRIRLLSWANHQIRALTLCLILCMTLTWALAPLPFYSSTGKCADMVSAPPVFFWFFSTIKDTLIWIVVCLLTSTCERTCVTLFGCRKRRWIVLKVIL